MWGYIASTYRDPQETNTNLLTDGISWRLLDFMNPLEKNPKDRTFLSAWLHLHGRTDMTECDENTWSDDQMTRMTTQNARKGLWVEWQGTGPKSVSTVKMTGDNKWMKWMVAHGQKRRIGTTFYDFWHKLTLNNVQTDEDGNTYPTWRVDESLFWQN